YAKERIAEGGLQTVGGVVSVVTGLGLIVATGGMATPVVAGAFVVGTCSMTYGISNTEEGLDNLYYGIKGDGKSIAVNPIRDSIFKSNPQLYYTIGNASTIISSMGAPIASGVPGEQVMATQTKRLASGAVGSIASNVLIDEYDMNPYIAMGIGMGISNITYRGINAVGNIEYVNGFGAKPVEAASMDNRKVKTISYSEYDSIYQSSVHNADADAIMLGKYDGGDPTSYISKAGKDYTYFDLGKEWGTIR